jgi:Flp pilus assembly pilin Flp
MRTAWLLSGCVLGLLAYQGPAAAQTVVEYGAGAGAAAAAAGAKGVGASIGGAFDSVGKALKQARDQAPQAGPATRARPATSTPARPKTEAVKDAEGPAAAPAAQAPPPPSYEDPMGIRKGMSCEEVTRRFGPPVMAFATEDDAKTMSYSSKAGGVQVECQGGKVASVDKPR